MHGFDHAAPGIFYGYYRLADCFERFPDRLTQTSHEPINLAARIVAGTEKHPRALFVQTGDHFIRDVYFLLKLFFPRISLADLFGRQLIERG